MQRTKFPSRQEKAALGSSATDLPGPPQKRLLPVDPEFIPKKQPMRFPTEGKKHGFFTSSLCSKGKDVRTLLKKWAMCGQKKNSGEL